MRGGISVYRTVPIPMYIADGTTSRLDKRRKPAGVIFMVIMYVMIMYVMIIIVGLINYCDHHYYGHLKVNVLVAEVLYCLPATVSVYETVSVHVASHGVGAMRSFQAATHIVHGVRDGVGVPAAVVSGGAKVVKY